jgi:transposase-like protein
MTIVWPCRLSVDAYVSAGRGIEFPRPDCPTCSAPMTRWSGYERNVRIAEQFAKAFIARARCKPCRVTHALVPSVLLASHYDPVDVIGAVLFDVAFGRSGVRPAAARAGVGRSTARSWVQRFGRVARRNAVAFAGLAVALGAAVPELPGEIALAAVAAIEAAFSAACSLPGWAGTSRWSFASAVSGGGLLASNTTLPYLVVGRRRFMSPVP